MATSWFPKRKTYVSSSRGPFSSSMFYVRFREFNSNSTYITNDIHQSLWKHANVDGEKTAQILLSLAKKNTNLFSMGTIWVLYPFVCLILSSDIYIYRWNPTCTSHNSHNSPTNTKMICFRNCRTCICIHMEVFSYLMYLHIFTIYLHPKFDPPSTQMTLQEFLLGSGNGAGSCQWFRGFLGGNPMELWAYLDDYLKSNTSGLR